MKTQIKIMIRLAMVATLSVMIATAASASAPTPAVTAPAVTTTTASVPAAPVVAPVKPVAPVAPKTVAKPAAAKPAAKAATPAEPAKEGDAPKTTSKDYDDWQMECTVPDKTTKKACHIFQRIVLKERKLIALTALVVMVKAPTGEPITVLRFIAPFGVLLPAGLTFGIDDGKQETLPFQICAQRGCITDMKLEKEAVDKLKASKEIRTFYNIPGQKDAFKVTISLKGFSPALDALKLVPPAE